MAYGESFGGISVIGSHHGYNDNGQPAADGAIPSGIIFAVIVIIITLLYY